MLIASPFEFIENGCQIARTAVIYEGVKLGKNVIVRDYAVLGSPGEKTGHFDKPGVGVVIGDNCVISEHVTVHAGIKRPTQIGNNCLLLTKAHVGHCAIIEDNVTLSCGTMVGGEAHVMKYSNVGLGAAIHQGCLVGPGAMIAAQAFVSKKNTIWPFKKYAGVPARKLGDNSIVFEKLKLSREEIDSLLAEWHRLLPMYLNHAL